MKEFLPPPIATDVATDGQSPDPFLTAVNAPGSGAHPVTRMSSWRTPPREAWAAVDRLLRAPAARLVVAGERHRELFRRLAEQVDGRGGDLPDAYLAAYAVENGATWLSADRGFARLAGLRWRHALD